MNSEQVFVNYGRVERTGKLYKIISMDINGIKYYFVVRINVDGFLIVFRDKQQAISVFEAYEKDAEKYG